ncbi:MAG TPA: ATP-binding protein [Methylocella sp.]|nr:ATP-binding protein [Methylocella sp.]
MSLRFRLICLIAIVLIASLAVEGTIVSFNASRSVQTEMNSALQVGQQIVTSALARLPESTDRRRDLEALVAAFKGNRHLRVSLTGGGAAAVAPSREGSHFGTVPPWFIRFLGIAPLAMQVPVVVAGQDYGGIVIETDPINEILEVWNDLGDGFLVLALFFGLNILLIYFFIGRALRPLDQLGLALQQIGHGNYKLRIGGNAAPELSRLLGSFNRMASELAELDEEKRLLNEQLLSMQEEERRAIARDLHDEISPFLFAVNADLAAIARLAKEGRGTEIAQEIQSTLDAVSHMQRQVKTMLGRLRPGILADFGLAAAIMSMVEFWRRRHPEIRFKTDLPSAEASFGAVIDITIYRIVQESLSNAVRHGNPAEITVSVAAVTADDHGQDRVIIAVGNDGHGMDKTAGFGFGLTGMRERVQALGGCLVLKREPGLGLSVTATLPLATPSRHVFNSSLAGGA